MPRPGPRFKSRAAQGGKGSNRSLEGDAAVLAQPARHRLDLGALRPGGDRHGAGVERHVTALDALGGERAQRGEVRGQADGGGDQSQLVGTLHPDQSEREPCRTHYLQTLRFPGGVTLPLRGVAQMM